MSTHSFDTWLERHETGVTAERHSQYIVIKLGYSDFVSWDLYLLALRDLLVAVASCSQSIVINYDDELGCLADLVVRRIDKHMIHVIGITPNAFEQIIHEARSGGWSVIGLRTVDVDTQLIVILQKNNITVSQSEMVSGVVQVHFDLTDTHCIFACSN